VQIAASPELQMLQAIKDEDSDPESRALYCKDHGNTAFVKFKGEKNLKVRDVNLHKAIKYYADGLEEKCDNIKLNSLLHSNRAAVNLILGNSRKVLSDCADAVQLDPSNIKAYFRGATACCKIDKYAEAIRWADNGLSVDPANKTLVDVRLKAAKQKGVVDKRARKLAAAERKDAAHQKALADAITGRGIALKDGVEVQMTQHPMRKGVVDTATGGAVFLDADLMLHWPMTLLYPEHKQTDFIKDFNEGHCFLDHLDMMFDHRVPWDAEGKYRPDNLVLYFETQPDVKNRTTIVECEVDKALLDILRKPGFTVVDMAPSMFVLAKGSPFLEQFLRTHKDDRWDPKAN
jgi:hypothetical protein